MLLEAWSLWWLQWLQTALSGQTYRSLGCVSLQKMSPNVLGWCPCPSKAVGKSGTHSLGLVAMLH